MSETEWSLSRLQNAKIAPYEATYEAVDLSDELERIKLKQGDIFKFKAISIGDEDGQAFFVPLEESGRVTTELILKALKAYHETT